MPPQTARAQPTFIVAPKAVVVTVVVTVVTVVTVATVATVVFVLSHFKTWADSSNICSLGCGLIRSSPPFPHTLSVWKHG